MNWTIGTRLLVVCVAIFLGGGCPEAPAPTTPTDTPTPSGPVSTVSVDTVASDVATIGPRVAVLQGCTAAGAPPPPAGSTCDALDLEANLTEDGVTTPATEAAWSVSDPQLATIAPATGALTTVTPLGAGPVNVTARVGAVQDSEQLLVVPWIAGTREGTNSVDECVTHGPAFEGICLDPDFLNVGDMTFHASTFSQDLQGFSAAFFEGGGTASFDGLITDAGEARQRAPAVFMPDDEIFHVVLGEWASTYTDAGMRGTAQLTFTADTFPGSDVVATFSFDSLQRVTGSPIRGGSDTIGQAVRALERFTREAR